MSDAIKRYALSYDDITEGDWGSWVKRSDVVAMVREVWVEIGKASKAMPHLHGTACAEILRRLGEEP